MDRTAWMEQVEAALETGDRAFLRMLDGLTPGGSQPELALVRCRLQAALGRAEAAAATFPDYGDIEDQPALHRAWAAAAVDLALAGAIPNHWGLGRALVRLAEQASGHRDPASALDVLERHVRAALARHAHQVAERGLDLAREVIDPADPQAPRLSKRRQRAAREAIEALAAQVAAHAGPDPELPDSPQALLAQLGADPERDLDRLVAGLARWPDRAELLHSAARCWQALDDEPAGTELFARQVAARPDDLELATAFGWHLVRLRDLATLDAYVQHRFFGARDPAVQARGHWLLARARLDRGALDTALASIQRMLALQPDSVPGRHLHAQVLRARGQEAAALALLDQLAAELPDDGAGPWHWDRMELGTVLGRWASVRDSAARLGMPVQPGDQPIDERWSPCRVLLPGASAAAVPEPALRTGPVTARLVGLAAPGMPQRYGDLVLVRAQALDDGSHPEGPLLSALQVLSRGGFTVQGLAGRHPGDEALRAFGERLHALGVPLQWWELAEPDPRGHTVHLRLGLGPDADRAAVEQIVDELRRALAG